MTIKNEEKVRNWENIILRWKQTSLSMTQFNCQSLFIYKMYFNKRCLNTHTAGLEAGGWGLGTRD